MTENDDFDALLLAQMREDFLVESQEILDQLGPLLVQLEKESALSPLPFVLGHRTGPFGTVPKDQGSLGQSPGSLSTVQDCPVLCPRIKETRGEAEGLLRSVREWRRGG